MFTNGRPGFFRGDFDGTHAGCKACAFGCWGEMLKQKMREERGYEAAMQAYFSLPARKQFAIRGQ